MGNKLLLFFVSIGVMIIGFNIMIDKSVPQHYKHELDLSNEPFVAYAIGGVFFMYGVYILYCLWRHNCEKKK